MAPSNVSYLGKLFKFGIPELAPFPAKNLKFLKYSSKYQHFREHTQGFKTKVCSSTKADTHGKFNFNVI